MKPTTTPDPPLSPSDPLPLPIIAMPAPKIEHEAEWDVDRERVVEEIAAEAIHDKAVLKSMHPPEDNEWAIVH